MKFKYENAGWVGVCVWGGGGGGGGGGPVFRKVRWHFWATCIPDHEPLFSTGLKPQIKRVEAHVPRSLMMNDDEASNRARCVVQVCPRSNIA
jgi:hypothetical protein